MTDLVILGGSYSHLRDYIVLAKQLDEKAFCERVSVPVLISRKKEKSASFRKDQTEFILDKRDSALPGEVARLDPRLQVLEVRQRTTQPGGYVTLGRADSCDLVVSDPTVSSRHAVFHPDEATGLYQLQDLNSKNGTLVDENHLASDKAVNLPGGNVLVFGDTVFLFLYPAGLYMSLQTHLTR
jgi:pSer/pThr/pTyr-binding forkhead associated (FHA) protein